MASHSGLWSPVAGGLSAMSTIGTVENFVGVYSGRLTALDFGNHNTNEVTELGLAWRKDALDEIVNSGISGTTLNQVSAAAPSQQV